MFNKNKTNKTLLSAIFATSLLIGGNSANALSDTKKSFYIGVGYQFNQVGYNNDTVELSTGSLSVDLGDYFEDSLNNYNLFAGVTLNDYNVSFELGYFKSDEESKSNNNTGIIWTDTLNAFTTNSTSELQIINLDAIYNHKLDNAERFNFLALGGISKISFDTTVSYLDSGVSRESTSDNQDGYGINLGIGLEAKLIDNVSVRGMIKYTTVSSVDNFDDLVSYNLGVKYQF